MAGEAAEKAIGEKVAAADNAPMAALTPALAFSFFLLIHYSRATYQIMARLFTVRFLSAVRAMAARCKRPFALRPGLSQEDVKRTKGITKERRASVKDKRDGRRKNTARSSV